MSSVSGNYSYGSSALQLQSLAAASHDDRTLARYIQTFQSDLQRDRTWLRMHMDSLLESVTYHMESRSDPLAVKKQFLLQLAQASIEQPLKEKLINICDELAGFDFEATTSYCYHSRQKWEQTSEPLNAFEQILDSRLFPPSSNENEGDPEPIRKLLENHRAKLEAGAFASQSGAAAASSVSGDSLEGDCSGSASPTSSALLPFPLTPNSSNDFPPAYLRLDGIDDDFEPSPILTPSPAVDELSPVSAPASRSEPPAIPPQPRGILQKVWDIGASFCRAIANAFSSIFRFLNPWRS